MFFGVIILLCFLLFFLGKDNFMVGLFFSPILLIMFFLSQLGLSADLYPPIATLIFFACVGFIFFYFNEQSKSNRKLINSFKKSIENYTLEHFKNRIIELKINLKAYEDGATSLNEKYNKPQRYATDKAMLSTKISENKNKINLNKKHIKILNKHVSI